MMTNFIPAATVVLLRQRDGALETLLLQRNKALNFAAGAWVFPGGKVDPIDLSTTDQPLEQAKIAAVRECQEEAGIELNVSQLTPFAHWTAPESSPKRFATWFFIAVVDGDDVVIDDSEITAYQWLTPSVALTRHRQKALPMLPPTYICLSLMLGFAEAGEVIRHLAEGGVRYYQPRLVVDDQGLAFLYQEDAGYADLNLSIPGRQHRCWLIEGVCDYIEQ